MADKPGKLLTLLCMMPWLFLLGMGFWIFARAIVPGVIRGQRFGKAFQIRRNDSPILFWLITLSGMLLTGLTLFGLPWATYTAP